MGDTINDPRQTDLVEMLEDQKLRELARKCVTTTTVVEEDQPDTQHSRRLRNSVMEGTS